MENERPAPAAIPRVINQIWIGPEPRPVRLMETWRDRHPGWGYRLWTDRDLEQLEPPLGEKAGRIPAWCGKADVLRWSLLHREGGVFVDADSECLLPLPESMLADDFFSCWENELARPGLVACGFMGARPGGALTAALLLLLRSEPATAEPAWSQVGPVFLTRVLRLRRWPGVRIHPSHRFLPEHYSGLRYTGPGPVYARHYWGSTADAFRHGGAP